MTKKKTNHDDSADLRKRAEEALRESEERYKELWERAPVAYHVLDPDGKIAKVNQTEASMLGYQVHEMVGKSIFDFILPEQRDEAQKRFCQKIQGLPIPRIENRIYLKKDGSRIYVVIDDVLERDAYKKVTGIRSTMTDITDRKRIEEERIKSEKKYRSLVETAGSGIAAIDQRGIFTFVNKTLCRMCGYAEQELIGKHFVGFLHPDDRKNVIQIFENAFINPIRNPYIEFRIIHKDGHIVYMCSNPTAFEYEGQLLGFNAIITDITELKRAEEALRESEERYRRLVETAPEVIYNLSAEDGTITLLNPAFERITGWSRAEWLGKPFMPLVHPDDLTLAMETFQQISRGEATPPYELRILSKSGEYFIGEFISFPHIEKRKVIGEFGIARDITERKKAEEVLRISEERYRTLFELMDEGFCVVEMLYDPDGKAVDYRFVETNPAFEKHTGLQQALGKTIRQMVPNHDAHWFEIYGKVARTGESIRFENPAYAMQRYYDVFAFRIGGDGSQRVGVLFNDITERKRAEEALRESKEFAENLIASMLDGISVLDSDGVHIDVNATLCQMTGFSREELIGVGLPHPYWPPEAYEEIETAFQKTLRGDFSDVELAFMRKNGERFPVIVSPSWIKDKQGNVISYFATVKDITERKRAEEEKRRLEERSRKVVEDIFRFIPEGVLVFSRKMELLRQNQAFRELVSGYAGRLGFAEDELENLIIDKIKAGLGDKNIKEIRISRKHETGK